MWYDFIIPLPDLTDNLFSKWHKPFLRPIHVLLMCYLLVTHMLPTRYSRAIHVWLMCHSNMTHVLYTSLRMTTCSPNHINPSSIHLPCYSCVTHNMLPTRYSHAIPVWLKYYSNTTRVCYTSLRRQPTIQNINPLSLSMWYSCVTHMLLTRYPRAIYVWLMCHSNMTHVLYIPVSEWQPALEDIALVHLTCYPVLLTYYRHATHVQFTCESCVTRIWHACFIPLCLINNLVSKRTKPFNCPSHVTLICYSCATHVLLMCYSRAIPIYWLITHYLLARVFHTSPWLM